MIPEPGRPRFARLVSALRSSLEARAAGLWRVEGDSLIQLAFHAASDMPREVADGFARATETVPLSGQPLGIIAAAVEGRAAVSVAADLSPTIGSGYWLRAFGASRSIAVPIEADGRTIAVVAVALSPSDRPDSEIEALLRSEAAAWFTNE